METRSIRIEVVSNGYVLRFTKESKSNVYHEPEQIVAETKDNVKELFNQWIEGSDTPSIDKKD